MVVEIFIANLSLILLNFFQPHLCTFGIIKHLSKLTFNRIIITKNNTPNIAELNKDSLIWPTLVIIKIKMIDIIISIKDIEKDAIEYEFNFLFKIIFRLELILLSFGDETLFRIVSLSLGSLIFLISFLYMRSSSRSETPL